MLQAGLRNKSDRNDARGIAHLMRMNAYRPVWVKSERSQRLSALFTARKTHSRISWSGLKMSCVACFAATGLGCR
jgi:transposase